MSEDFSDEFKKGCIFVLMGKVCLVYMFLVVFGIDGYYLDQQVKSIVEEGIREGVFFGVQVLVVKDGVVVYYKVFGYYIYDSS